MFNNQDKLNCNASDSNKSSQKAGSEDNKLGSQKCGCKCEIYSRVTGYFRPVANWNIGKKEEFNDRLNFKVA